ncbi:MAG: hypothetical protein KDJ65_01640 [Anaerolineae bacterium]|nr:hypothetical protein [Anaerolineae bacterium]
MAKFDNMTIAQLEGEMAKLRTKKAALQEQLREAHIVYDKMRATQAAREKITAMSDEERAALVQAIKTEGIQSTEEFGAL